MENFSGEPEILSNNQMKILKHKNKISYTLRFYRQISELSKCFKTFFD